MRAAYRILTAILAIAALEPAPAGAAEIEVELELVLLADASSSIRGPEFDLQVGGYANAFRDDRVVDAIAALGGNGIAATFVQWSATFQQFDTVPWRHIRTRADAEAFARAVETQARRVVSFGTATGDAMTYGAGLFDGNGFAGRRRVIDISSDERSNQGPHPGAVRGAILERGITVNGLAILDDAFDLKAYFTEFVIGGPGAFVLAVDDYRDFANAISLKLTREISGRPLVRGRVPPRAAQAAGSDSRRLSTSAATRSASASGG